VINGHTKDGKGELRNVKDGSVYRGDFKGGFRSGRGELVLANGDKYAGEF
jgi:hypothetical protein